MKRSSSSGEQSRGPGQSKLSQFFSKRQKESIEDPSVELSHGSGTCLPQESKGSGTLSGSKAETNDDAASTSRSRYDHVTLIPLEHKRNGGYVIGAQAE